MAIVQIGSQYWFKENLAVESFQDGTPIAEVSSSEQWEAYSQSGTPGWCYYNFDEGMEEEYGKLYNWHAVSGSHASIAPTGFRVPTEGDWNTLVSVQGGTKVAGNKLKNTANWSTLSKKSGNGNNESVFTVNPNGYMKENGEQYDFGWSANFWTATTSSAATAVSTRLYWSNDNVVNINTPFGMGLAIRLVHSSSYSGSMSGNPAIDF